MNTKTKVLVCAAVLLMGAIIGWYVYRNRETLFEGAHLYTLPALPYEFSSLEPHIDTETMKIHYTKHHQAYVDNLNAALKDHPDLRKKSLEYLLTHTQEIPDTIRKKVIDNGGGHYNHSFFWLCMKPQSSQAPHGKLKELLEKTFGSFEKFKEQFTRAALTVFGSGWVWLVESKDGKLSIMTTPNQDCPLTQDYVPLLGLDVWEHAYYLKYHNRRNDYSDAWWHLVNWEQVEKNYESAHNRTEQKGA